MSDYERPIVLERCCYTSTQHLRRRDFRDVVGWVHCRTGRELGVAGLVLWNWVRGLPLVAQIIVWVLFLPSMLASLRFAQIRPIGQTSDMRCSLDEIHRCFIDIGGGG